MLPELTLGADTYTFEHPLNWNVLVSNTGGSLLVTGIVSGDAVTTCVRCLDPAEYRLEGEVEGYFTIDLTSLLVAALSLELPQTPLCDDDCKGLCSGCGANLNYEECTCDKSEVEEDFHENPFAVLKNLKFDDE